MSQLTALTHLGLESNALQQIGPGALEGLGKLEVLQLQDNQLQQLPQGLGEQAVVSPAACVVLAQALWACRQLLCKSARPGWLLPALTNKCCVTMGYRCNCPTFADVVCPGVQVTAAAWWLSMHLGMP